ncbi:MAG: PPC domain-containing protein, partial [Limisphaerales bacterium]
MKSVICCAAWLLAVAALPLSAADPKPKAKAQAAAPAGIPVITRLEPRGIQRGAEMRLKLVGGNLAGVTNVTFHNPKITGALQPDAKANETWLKVTAAPDLARGSYDLSVKSAAGESARVKLFVDDLRQADAPSKTESLPVSFWGTLEQPGKPVEFSFTAAAGQNLVCDLAAERLGSKAVNAMLTLLDERGRVLAVNRGFDGSSDALLVHRVAAPGRYTLRVSDLQYMASPEHFFRVSVGELPVVTGIFPLAVPADKESEIQIAGENLPPGASVRMKAGATGEASVVLDPEKFRARKEFKVLVSSLPELMELEPNDSPDTATTIPVPGAVNGRLGGRVPGPAKGRASQRQQKAGAGGANDVDLFHFEARKGQHWVIETMAAQRGSPADTKIEVLHADGRPVERLWLQAVRDSSVTFRGIDSVNPDCRLVNWEEMELNQFVYLGGEVVRLFRAPRGP